MKRIDYDSTIEAALAAVRSPDGVLGSGSVTALTLSLAVECLSLHVAQTRSRPAYSEYASYYAELDERLSAWRMESRRAFVDDHVHFAGVIEARTLRERAPDATKKIHAGDELEHLARANAVLLRLIDLSLALAKDAELMLQDRGSKVAEGEGATALYLAEAATSALAMMLASNVRSATRRHELFGLTLSGLPEIRDAVDRLPPGPARERLKSEVAASPAIR